MKKKICFVCILILMTISNVFAASNPYPKTQTFNGKQSVPCTYVAWQETYNRLGIALPGGWGNAVNWLKNAKKAGFKVGETPKPNSLAVYSGYYGYGHVAFVTAVYDEYMHIVEGGVVGAEKAERDTSFEIGVGDGIYLTGFIYLDEIPKSTNTNTSTSSKTTTTTAKKDDNSYLKTLKIEGMDFDFQKETFTYLLNVPNEMDSIKLTLEAEKKTSKIESEEAYPLEIGENIISIKVIAEDKSSSTYNLYITREEKQEEETVETIVEQPSTKKVSWKIIVPIIVFAVLFIIGIVVIIKRKLRKKKSVK